MRLIVAQIETNPSKQKILFHYLGIENILI